MCLGDVCDFRHGLVLWEGEMCTCVCDGREGEMDSIELKTPLCTRTCKLIHCVHGKVMGKVMGRAMFCQNIY